MASYDGQAFIYQRLALNGGHDKNSFMFSVPPYFLFQYQRETFFCIYKLMQYLCDAVAKGDLML